jgi:hypothetical protein
MHTLYKYRYNGFPVFSSIFHISANPCDGMTCQNNGTCLVNMADGTAQCCCTSGFTGANCENAGKNCIIILLIHFFSLF